MSTLQTLFGTLGLIGLLALFAWQYAYTRAKREAGQRALLQPLYAMLTNPILERGATAGVWTLTGGYQGHLFQIKSLIDTLALRKLPSLWFLITLPEPQPVHGTVDLMMRAAGVASFSNFDFLPHTLAAPQNFPADATIRSDRLTNDKVVSLLGRHLDLFHHAKGKEFLISPKGLRIVLQLAEADRARYGVLREARFEGATVDPLLIQQVMDTLLELRNDLINNDQT